MQLLARTVIVSYWALVTLLLGVTCCRRNYRCQLSDENKENHERSMGSHEPEPYWQDEINDLKIAEDIKKAIELEEKNAENTSENDDVPEELDWSQEGYVTPVGNQQPCECCCWAFAITGIVEGLQKKVTGKLVALSKQNLVDCIKDYIDKPECPKGEDAPDVFEYIMKFGIETDESQPYTGQLNGKCRQSPDSKKRTINSYHKTSVGDEKALKFTIATYGPVAVNIDSKSKAFKDYRGGIYEGPCNNKLSDLDHEVVAVGYGKEGGKEYWILKNSWGIQWGEQGYMRLARNVGNLCGIATNAYYIT